MPGKQSYRDTKKLSAECRQRLGQFAWWVKDIGFFEMRNGIRIWQQMIMMKSFSFSGIFTLATNG
ncbi:hypothetical protein WJ17_00260 [Burkholderia vietnamiensis]|nr:hypothetical protein WJ17_00260 [Burkholderia vietnamiensis]